MKREMIEAIEEIKAASEKAYNYYLTVRDGYKVYRIGNEYYTEDANGFYPAWGGFDSLIKELEMVATI